ncbi:cob(I)yrinic acid a,c-diamide adenosyltransferase [Methylotenera sp.]|jgi:cob(I)alamin adenosyltransferase|uniref:cob(I)yrinic acid a,c-diamide adenosyltransferase n=1 Tax=Methylotenera sp. TaxID=2051956 RepID=UPI00273136EC|nr:cob(I)yrinic acid a,c-diamide adenosyltransferase [Methylotenera sp.]MDP2070878.1 cob(I)yrinic acid a,c-diamide adenosyltransferase [Methylotenera sp.]MDP2230233.1 cob(I)yrinic acid a,c-diamide adenosyltransferase [Methylotenera sp.]MDP3005752.1 cob(I)yrinic acid a,c-diamide adenosyltransferase [Methylotenera sp.]MDP3140189.1 cob(I)yrinic acid a,c-diamide adenosyltransferase [Methylotenera sp.]
MGNRLSKIYTRTGDDGTTGLGDGSRINKDSLRVDAMGDVDELNSVIGILLTEAVPDILVATLIQIQHDLFNVGGEICIPGYVILHKERIENLEESIDALNGSLAPLKEFILPGGTKAAAYCHLARTVCRRAERKLVELHRNEKVTDISLQYLNRLSDLLFVMCRIINKEANVSDVLWKNEHD